MHSNPRYNYAGLQRLASKYEQTPYFRRLPLALHPTLHLIPFIGTIIVFVQTVKFINNINAIARVPPNTRMEIWITAVVLLFLGLIPFFGILLSVCLKSTPCTDYMLETSPYFRQSAYFYQQQRPVDLLSSRSITVSRPESMAMSPFAPPEGIYATRSSRSNTAVSAKSHAERSHKKSGSGHKSSARYQNSIDKYMATDGVAISIQEPAPVQAQSHAVFDRVSKMDWMEDVMAISPTDHYRTSLSTGFNTRNRSQTLYTDIHELATRNSTIDPTLVSTKDLPEYLTNDHNLGGEKDSVKIKMPSKRMTQSLCIDASILDKRESLSKGFKLLKRPDYSHLKHKQAGDSEPASLINLESCARKLV
ncbi:hypothetical protein LPJ66_003984 [Kickxella alabastrina]|uniref:Uncharacterized protein n=1 Tax=Kickxella alabastrina TaxID=61397 RepID=A0ACC1IMC0_9FUNG|nr:hypothetical protein LPJ66_003984 [Kickxella alabastrina]